MKTSVSTKGQIVIPAEFRRRDGIEPGQQFDMERIDSGKYKLVRRTSRPNEGVVDWLLACPEKGYFVPMGSESTDTLVSQNRKNFQNAGVSCLDPFA